MLEILANDDISSQSKWDQVADIVNESHKSIAHNLECASKQVNKLRDLMLQLGCKGVKLLSK